MLRFCVILSLILTLGCAKEQDEVYNFYYWKTTYQTSDSEKETLTANHCKKIYIRLCDISLSYDRKPHPQNVLKWTDSADKNIEYVPVIFIENNVFSRVMETAKLAKNVTKLLHTSWNFANTALEEVQIDCDWTSSTRDTYFKFLTDLKKQNPKLILSATIRLHQIKYATKTGIPPIDKAVLMCYNMGEIKRKEEVNSIYSIGIIKEYIKQSIRYNDIPMAIALPVYSWSLSYRNNNFVGIINNLPLDTLAAYGTKTGANIYKCTNDRLQTYKIQPGDEIRYEQVTSDQLIEGKNYLSKYLKSWNNEIIYFDLDSNTLINYDKKIL